MKVRVSVTLSKELLGAIDDRARQQSGTRSDFIEAALWTFIRQLARDERNVHDLEITIGARMS